MFFEVLKSRRSIRKYENREVEKEKIDLLLKSALLAPSSRSRRPWEFIVVTDRVLLQELSNCREHSSKFLGQAPLGIVVIADPQLSDVWVEDTSIASIILQLAAHSLGLGSCWIQIRDRQHSEAVSAEEYVKKVLGIPGRYKVENIIAIGYRGEFKAAYDESQLPLEKIHYNSY